MKKIAIFTEGQTERVFIRNLLLRILNPSKISFECFDLIANRQQKAPWQHPNPNAHVHFLILNVGCDEGVLSSIKDREKNLIEKNGYDRIIALRDMYCEQYDKRSPKVICESISQLIVERHNRTIGGMTYPDKIKLIFAIMEIEAWFLGMYHLFSKIDSRLTVEFIEERLGINLMIMDPQKQFYKPSAQLKDVLRLSGREYDKRLSEVEGICSKMDRNDFKEAMENGRCLSFSDLCQELLC